MATLGRGIRQRSSPGNTCSGAAVEEESHMGVLLRLGNAELSIALAGDILTEDIGQLPVGEGHQHVGHGGVILGSTHIGHRK